MKKLTGRPSETIEFPIMENDVRIFLNPDDVVIRTTTGRPKKNEVETKILDFLQANPRSTTSEICRGLGKDSVSAWTSMNKVLTRLEKEEFVQSREFKDVKGKCWIKTDKEWQGEGKENQEETSKAKKKYKYHHALYIGEFLPTEKWTFKEETPAGRGTYMKTKFYPRSALVIIGDFPAGKKYISVPAGTQMFYTAMNELGILSSIGEDFSGQPVTLIVNSPDPETIQAYEKTEIYYFKH
jgi:hypothetical protein